MSSILKAARILAFELPYQSVFVFSVSLPFTTTTTKKKKKKKKNFNWGLFYIAADWGFPEKQ